MRAVVILSTADYDAAVWTNKQHIASRLATTHSVTYIDSMGLRAPRLTVKDVTRITRRVIASILPKARRVEQVDRPIEVVVPRVLPWHRYRLVREVNRLLVRRLSARLPKEYDLWTFSPLTYGLDEAASSVIYHSVDLLHEIDGVPRAALLDAEERMVGVADACVASSSVIAEHLRTLGAARVLLWENVADTGLFSAAADGRAEGSEPRTGVVFAGNLSPSKVDFGLLAAIAAKGYQLTLAGPSSIDGTRAPEELRRLTALDNVEYLGNLAQDELAEVLARHRIGVIPYLQNNYTAGVFPMKVHEYGAAGLRVVATDLPALVAARVPWLTSVRAGQFLDAVERIYDLEAVRLADEELRVNSWEARVDQVRDLLGKSATEPTQ